MYKIDNKNLRAKIKNLEQRLDFQRYNIKKKQKEKGRKKKKELLKNKQANKKLQIGPLSRTQVQSVFVNTTKAINYAYLKG